MRKFTIWKGIGDDLGSNIMEFSATSRRTERQNKLPGYLPIASDQVLPNGGAVFQDYKVSIHTVIVI